MERRKVLFLLTGGVACVCPIIFGCLFGVLKSTKDPEIVIETSVNEPVAYSNMNLPANRSDEVFMNDMRRNEPAFHDIVIIGAGLSGLSAAVKLCDSAPQLHVLVLEATNRPGGRIFSTNISASSYIEVGARWLIGSDHNALQPLADLAHVHRAKERRAPTMKILKNMLSLSLCVNETLSESGLCTKSSDEFDDVMLQGAHNIVQYLITLLQESNCHIRIEYNTIVSNITTSESVAVIQTEDGAQYRASFIISSIPAGVLQESSVSFQPGLPYAVHQAIQNLDVIKTSVIHLVLREPVPNMTESYYSMDTTRSKHLDMVNLIRFTGENILAFYANHQLSIDLEDMSDEEVIGILSNTIQTAFGTAPSISQSLVSHWGLHPHVRGAYTTLSDCSTPQDRATLREPIGGRLILTGEWVASHSPGTLTGAFLSGIESARRVLEAYDDQTCTIQNCYV